MAVRAETTAGMWSAAAVARDFVRIRRRCQFPKRESRETRQVSPEQRSVSETAEIAKIVNGALKNLIYQLTKNFCEDLLIYSRISTNPVKRGYRFSSKSKVGILIQVAVF